MIRQDLLFEKLRIQSRVDLAMKSLDAKNFSSRLRKVANINQGVGDTMLSRFYWLRSLNFKIK